MKLVSLSLILFSLLVFQISAQSLFKSNKIPDDLVITLKRTGQFEDYTITIKANGDWDFAGYAGLPKGNSFGDMLSGEKKAAKKVDYTKAKLAKTRLKSLISEFEKIQFFKFGNDFPQEDEKILTSISSQSTETISIRINGQTKEVSNYLGTSGKRGALLRDLGEKIRDVRVWNLENGNIPEDLKITYGIGYGGGSWRQSVIKPDGSVWYKFDSMLPSNPNLESALQTLDKRKKPKLKDKLSKKQLEQIISEFEKIGFSAFRNRTLDSQYGCSNENLSTHGGTRYISININNTNMSVSIYDGCDAKPGTDAAKVEYIVAKIEEMLKTVKAVKMDLFEN